MAAVGSGKLTNTYASETKQNREALIYQEKKQILERDTKLIF